MRSTLAIFTAVGLAACASTGPVPSTDFPKADWQSLDGQDDFYLLAPGDTMEIVVHSAPELTRTVIVAPDGRIRLPLADPVTAAARTADEVRAILQASLAGQLKDPDLDVVPLTFPSQQIFVGGAVENAGVFDLPGQIDPLQAITLAGGFTDEALRSEVVIMRRLPGGEVRSTVVDIRSGVYEAVLADWGPLRRFDVVYVPKSRIARQNLAIQQFVRNALPIQFSLFYDVSGGR